jgi:predicted aspartyl protease
MKPRLRAGNGGFCRISLVLFLSILVSLVRAGPGEIIAGVKIGDPFYRALVDTGATHTVLSAGLVAL